MYKLYLQKGDLNQATEYYVDVLRTAVERKFGKVKIVDEVKSINQDDIVIIIAMYSLIAVLKHRFNQKFIYWYQGIHAEEMSFNSNKVSLRTRLRMYYMSFFEWLCLRKSKFNFFVSDAMLQHFRKKYNYKGDNYYIMPCYNQQINIDAFLLSGKYSKPTLVYAGAMLPWQCFDELFQLYAKLKERLPDASLTLLTKDKDIVLNLIKKYNVADVNIDFVPLEQLNGYMSKFKYGFLLRADDIVNNVATPTKFNSYLAVGVIPIVSRTIHSFNSIINGMKYCIPTIDEKDLDTAVDHIIEMEKVHINGIDVFDEYNQVFDNFYNTDRHIENISNALTSMQ